MVLSSTSMIAAVMRPRRISHRALSTASVKGDAADGSEEAGRSADMRALLQKHGGGDGHPGTKWRSDVGGLVEHDLHGNPLYDLYEVPGGVVGRQQAEGRAR